MQTSVTCSSIDGLAVQLFVYSRIDSFGELTDMGQYRDMLEVYLVVDEVRDQGQFDRGILRGRHHRASGSGQRRVVDVPKVNNS